MLLQECYAVLGGDYEDVMSRLRSEKLVQKFVLKFPNDGSYDLLCTSLEQKNYDDAFRAAHTIKGMCQNLGFTKLLESSHLLTEELRGGYTPQVDGLAAQVIEDYKVVVDAIKAFEEGISD